MKAEIVGILALIVTVIAMLCACSTPGHAQTPLDTPGANICLYHWETIARDQPAGRHIITLARPYGWASPVDAVAYLRQLPIGPTYLDHERAVVAAQYSLAANPSRSNTAGEIQLRAYLTTDRPELATLPAVTLRDAVRRYLWSGSALDRAYWGHWLMLAVSDPVNRPCNPWRVY
jgi:hypothetical protein